MNFAHPLLESAIQLKEGNVFTMVIENPVALRKTVDGLKSGSDEIVLSENFTPIDMLKNAELIDNVFEVDFSGKRILSRLAGEAQAVALDYPTETFELMKQINDYAGLISDSINYPVRFSAFEDAEKLMSLLNFTVDDESMELPEVLLTYMEMCRDFLGKKLFIFLNLKSFVSSDEFELFCKHAAYEKFRVLLIEAFDCERCCEQEKKIIIDNDLCVIHRDEL